MKVKIALFFSILFMSMIAAPTIITLIDSSQDVTIFLDLNEEEEESTVEETSKELKLYQTADLNLFFRKTQKIEIVIFHSKNYVSQYLKTTTPPPKFAI
ncbi:hypothetical protein J2Q11_01545 [Tenacibaculum finnmarkense genomovar finnmarkense]|uniref:Uncharacterized protein n=2 Tax=Tenacibaculum finnmarkense TaxID=2781243 RepID=A0A2I2M8A5_9FLAO|nr:hypothetical protein [Tenacibaculum finnmarkense]MBE7633443.1 hypothetical protein [Tenacibaculum finnmarkense genomovar ulcerans]MBE7645079.1 hypothetical protein [Tenacibaculum finnmarkense genomovar ulcerans]MBE7647237.1 hypothetical protein [Tenacibaculum finnmarkense genomovar ulcerans]MBE7651627.1 hypothetical protein [Tenacibaculum finnmarkense genomovar finnmarkense]MBE7659573.1 hypothetical protein [Tenacibaculum finnmarkense genomovar finnmarkense]